MRLSDSTKAMFSYLVKIGVPDVYAKNVSESFGADFLDDMEAFISTYPKGVKTAKAYAAQKAISYLSLRMGGGNRKW